MESIPNQLVIHSSKVHKKTGELRK